MSYESLMAEWTEEAKEKGEHIAQLEAENAKLRAAVAKAIKVQTYLCADKDKPWCDMECALHRADTDDCEACDLIGLAAKLGIEVG